MGWRPLPSDRLALGTVLAEVAGQPDLAEVGHQGVDVGGGVGHLGLLGELEPDLPPGGVSGLRREEVGDVEGLVTHVEVLVGGRDVLDLAGGEQHTDPLHGKPLLVPRPAL